MNSKPYSSINIPSLKRHERSRFYTETIEVPRMAALAFFEAGEKSYAGKRMFWQNPENTMQFVGLGHAHVITAASENRFSEVSEQWQLLCEQIVNEEPAVQPVLFGGFSFDPENEKESVWTNFPDSFFAVPKFQLLIKDDRAYVSIHLITESAYTFDAFEMLRKERDELIHAAQVTEPADHEKAKVARKIEIAKEDYLASIQTVTDAIQRNEAEKVVIARSLQLDFEKPVKPATVLQQIANEQPNSFLFGMEAEEQFFFGATPERLVKVRNNEALSTCLAGSTPRGKTAEEDARLGADLMNDPKNRSEHAYVVRMISSVFDQHCVSTKVPPVPKLLKIRDIQHLYTPVSGRLSQGASLFDLVKELHPTPALGGEPKQAALELIRQVEPVNRGYYAAPIGWVDAQGNGEFAVAIRSALLNGDKAYLYAGGGIVEDSQPEAEYAETWVKFRPMLRALGGKLRDES